MKKTNKSAQYYSVICGKVSLNVSLTRRSLILFVFLANFITLNYGIAVGWPSASLPLLQSNLSPLPGGPLTLLESSWIGSVMCLGGASGQIFFGWLAGKFGRKPAILFALVPGAVRESFFYSLTSETFQNFYYRSVGC